MDKEKFTEEEWKAKLTPEQYKVLRERGTEAPFSGEHVHNTDDGTFTCMGCGAELFDSSTKFDSGSGWPSFDKAIDGAVEFIDDSSHGMNRTEAVCAVCNSHLGHVFNDGPTDSGKRFCINSVSLDHKEK